MTDLADLPGRIERLRARLSGASGDRRLLAEMENLLAEGYLAALRGEACSRRLGIRLESLMEAIEQPGWAVEARRIALDKRRLDREVHDLRAQLADMREEFARLGGGNPATG